MFDRTTCDSISPDGCGCLKMKHHQKMGSFPCKNPFNHDHRDKSFVGHLASDYPKRVVRNLY